MLRWLIVLNALVLVAACGNTGNDGSADGGGGGSVCDGKGSCAECEACAEQGPCAVPKSQCQQSSDCTGLYQCVASCGANLSCQDDCATNIPLGVSLFNAWSTCVFCDQCPSDCAGYQTCN